MGEEETQSCLLSRWVGDRGVSLTLRVGGEKVYLFKTPQRREFRGKREAACEEEIPVRDPLAQLFIGRVGGFVSMKTVVGLDCAHATPGISAPVWEQGEAVHLSP